MFLGALVDAGVPGALLESAVAALKIGARLEISQVKRGGITATKVDVRAEGATGEAEGKRSMGIRTSRSLSTRMRTTMSMSITMSMGMNLRGIAGGAPAPHEHPHGRGLSEIKRIIGAAEIGNSARRTAIAIFEALGAAEAKIHGVDVEKIHFHEVGAVDAMVDIVCAAAGAGALGVDEIVCSPLNVGGGTVECAHGTIPVPAPATVELLKGALGVLFGRAGGVGNADWSSHRESAGVAICVILRTAMRCPVHWRRIPATGF